MYARLQTNERRKVGEKLLYLQSGSTHADTDDWQYIYDDGSKIQCICIYIYYYKCIYNQHAAPYGKKAGLLSYVMALIIICTITDCWQFDILMSSFTPIIEERFFIFNNGAYRVSSMHRLCKAGKKESLSQRQFMKRWFYEH